MTRFQKAARIDLICILVVAGSLSMVSSVPAAQIVFYDFNDASNAAAAADQSGNGNTGTIAVATYTADRGGRTGQAGDRALDFGAFNNGAVLTVPSAATGAFDSLTQNDAASVAFWQFGGAEQPVNQWSFLFDPGRQLGSHAPWGDGTIIMTWPAAVVRTNELPRMNRIVASTKDSGITMRSLKTAHPRPFIRMASCFMTRVPTQRIPWARSAESRLAPIWSAAGA